MITPHTHRSKAKIRGLLKAALKELKPNAASVLEAAIHKGSITTAEIVNILPEGISKKGRKFKNAIGLIGQLLHPLDAAIYAGDVRVRMTSVKQFAALIALQKPSKSHAPLPLPFSSRKSAAEKPKKIILKDIGTIDEEEPGDDFFHALEIVHESEDLLEEIGEQTRPPSLSSDILAPYLFDMRQYQLLNRADISALSHRWIVKKERRAWQTLVNHNLRYVIAIAKTFMGRGIDLSDLIQEGNMGLMTAAERFDYRKGFTFTTYAKWWIMQKCLRVVADQKSTVRLPVHLQADMKKVIEVNQNLTHKLERAPTMNEMLKEVLKKGCKIEGDIDNVLWAMKLFGTSLDAPVSCDEAEETSAYDHTSDQSAWMPYQVMYAKEDLEKAHRCLRRFFLALDGIGQKRKRVCVFCSYYGLRGQSAGNTLQMLGDKFGVSRERIRQYNVETWHKLRWAGMDMDENSLISLIDRVDELEKIVGDEKIIAEIRRRAGDAKWVPTSQA